MSLVRASILVAAVIVWSEAAAPGGAIQATQVAEKPELDRMRSAADRGDSSAMLELGLTYQLGRHVKRDYAQAMVWFQKAAGLGNAEAMLRIGFLYSNGAGVPEDDAQAAAWYRKASDRGHGRAMFFLATAYWAGRGVPQDFVEAYKWLDLSATFASGEDRERSAISRDSLGKSTSMTPQLVAEARKRARAWQAAFRGSSPLTSRR